ncbi:hypothetical protein [Streptomyces sp. MMG1533]|uniref:hypothetical protein n=1 Tax=Streptomyces sp. MMG1533 TaxID=1415546 RepID=UPI001F1BC153|nr:hypothetical protein [Streptomyces sp. MMG1533]
MLTLRCARLSDAPDLAPELPGGNDLLSEQGRGLRLVEPLVWRWGWHRVDFDEPQVWCTFVIETPTANSSLNSGLR